LNKKFWNRAIIGFVLLLMFFSFFQPNTVSAATYSVTINTYYNETVNGNSVPIMKDGIPTGYYTPHTFSNLTGEHNFTVPYEDASGHFTGWGGPPVGLMCFTTLNVLASGTFYANYATQINKTIVTWPEQRYFVTPSDPAVVAVASNKSWSDILDWVATHITYNASLDFNQFPNETLAYGSGVCREYASLCVSMLISREYNAYVVAGNTTSGMINHAWIVLELNSTFYHFDPQYTWGEQPDAAQWANNYTAQLFYNDKVLLPAGDSQDPPPPPPDYIKTYSVTIKAVLNIVNSEINVPIFHDGFPTAFITPHSFTGLTGVHNFTVAYEDASGCHFDTWTSGTPGNRYLTTINVSSGGTYWAIYDTGFNLSQLSRSQLRYLITPNDPAIIAAASNKSWIEIVNFVSELPTISHESTDPLQFPNQTIVNGGRFFPDYASLCCSMLRAEGYTAYMACPMDTIYSSWVVLDLNGTFVHLNVYSPWSQQLISYEAGLYIDENGIYQAGVSQDLLSVIPEFSPAMMLATLVILTLTSKLIFRKKH
jgi:hypothetical protein